MDKFDLYKVDLKGNRPDVQKIDYLLNDQFFTHLDQNEIQGGKVNTEVTINRTADMFTFSFRLQGEVTISCDRCLDNMTQPIDTTARLVVKFGKEFSEESDEVVIIPEQEGIINLAWYLYEFIVLAIPIQHVHPTGMCNKEMADKLAEHTAGTTDDSSDPRWEALKKLTDRQ